MDKQVFLITMAKELGLVHNGEIISVPGVHKTFDTHTLVLSLNKLAGDFAANQIMAELEAEKRGIHSMHDRAVTIIGSNKTTTDEPK